jgi:hypothetical protein
MSSRGARWVLTSLCAVPVAWAADPPERKAASIIWAPSAAAPERLDPVREAYSARPRDDYERAIYRLMVEIMRVDAAHLVCQEQFRETKGDVQEAYEDWQDDHRDAVHDISVHARAMILRNSKGDPDIAHVVEGWYRGDAVKETRSFMMRSPEDVRAVCARFEDFVARPEFDIERNGANDLALIRRRPLAAAK